MYASPSPRAVLFDFFGTLTNAVRRGTRHAEIARTLGCPPEKFIAELDRTFYRRAAGTYGPPVEALRRIAFTVGGRPSFAQLSRAVAARVDAVRRDTVLRPEAVPVLTELRRRGLAVVLISDCWYELPAFLPRLPVAPLLDSCVYSIDVGHCKPHPAMYLEACRRQRIEPAECLYVGDGGSRELSGARNVGMPAARLAATDLTDHLAFHPEIGWRGPAVDSLTDVLALVDRVPSAI
jgi:putative hydrolase of the HAD superfamily